MKLPVKSVITVILFYRSFTTLLPLACHFFATRLSLVCHSFATRLPLVFHSFATRLPLVCHSFATRLPLVYCSFTTRFPLVCHSFSTRLLFVTVTEITNVKNKKYYKQFARLIISLARHSHYNYIYDRNAGILPIIIIIRINFDLSIVWMNLVLHV